VTATAFAWPVPDLRSYFTGGWRIDRSLVDRRQAIDGNITGEAHFTPDGAALLYRERGEMTFGAYAGPAEQAYRYEFPHGAARASVRFRDGRLFHELDLTHGHAAVTHRCAADAYEGRFDALDGNCWRSEWRIVGPRKDQAIMTVYTRIV
jgi:hypothetical protein